MKTNNKANKKNNAVNKTMKIRRWRKPLVVTPLSRLGERVAQIRAGNPSVEIVGLVFREHPTEVAAVYPHVQRVARELQERGLHAIPVKIDLKDTNYQIVREYAKVIARHLEGKATDEERERAKEEAARRLIALDDSIVRAKKIADEHGIHAVSFHATPGSRLSWSYLREKWNVPMAYNAASVIEVRSLNKPVKKHKYEKIAVDDLNEYSQELEQNEGASIRTDLKDDYHHSTSRRKRNIFARVISSKVSGEIADGIDEWVSGKERKKGFKKLLSRFRAN